MSMQKLNDNEDILEPDVRKYLLVLQITKLFQVEQKKYQPE